jgi:short-subunit dehydrogenase
VNIDGQHILVTGGSQGIGVDIAREFSRRGGKVTVLGRNATRLAAVAAEIGGCAVALDLTEAAALDGAIAEVESQVGPVDVLVNNAGAVLVREAALYRSGEQAQLMMINAVAPMELVRQVLPGMTTRGRGHIVNISSLAGVSAVPHLAVYGAAKAALHHYTAVVQRELAFTRAAVGLTLVTLGEVAGTQMMEDARQSPVIAAVSARLARVRAMPNIQPADVARAVARAVERNDRHVNVPRRIGPLIAVRNLPSRLQDLALRGIDSQSRRPDRSGEVEHRPAPRRGSNDAR